MNALLKILPLALLATGSVHARPDGAQLIHKIHITHTTSTAAHAQTGEDFSLRISRPGAEDVHLPFPNLPHDEREPGLVDTYTFSVADRQLSTQDLSSYRFHLRTHGKDAWLPQNIKVEITISGSGRIPIMDIAWPEAWFSTTWEETDKGTPQLAAAEWELTPQGVPDLDERTKMLSISADIRKHNFAELATLARNPGIDFVRERPRY